VNETGELLEVERVAVTPFDERAEQLGRGLGTAAVQPPQPVADQPLGVHSGQVGERDLGEVLEPGQLLERGGVREQRASREDEQHPLIGDAAG
jgi:hypothetical protein